jgi:hypothetical protein
MVPRQFQRALLFVAVVTTCVAQSPKSITYLRLSTEIVQQRSQPPAPAEDWSDALLQLYTKAGIPRDQVSRQDVPGSPQKMIVCTLTGRGDSVLVVSASLARPKDEDAASIAWASLAMLPLLAESINGVSTESTILFIAFPGEPRHHPSSPWYVTQLSEAQRRKVKAAVEISGIGRGRTSYDIKKDDRSLSDWLATAALALNLPNLYPVYDRDALDFADAKAFRSFDIPAITVSSWPQRVPHSFSAGYTPLNQLSLYEYYNSYQLLCVFLLDLDRVPRGTSPKSTIPAPSNPQHKTEGQIFTVDEVNSIIAAQINDERARHGSRTLRWLGIGELQGLACEMARNNRLETSPVEDLLKQKKLSGAVVVFSGDYPSLTPEQLQGLKIGRYQRLAIATCILASAAGKGPTYWIAAAAYE